jgi:tRNA(adenine34) deaminase
VVLLVLTGAANCKLPAARCGSVTPMSMSREPFMEAALDQARLALAAGEVPIGAVLVIDGQIVARGFNQPITSCDPTAHAEILVLRDGARTIGNYRLTDADLYVTLEPCLMCVGALVHARVKSVIYGAAEPKTGALVSTVRALETPGLNHRFEVTGGVLEMAARELIQEFFRGKRRASDATPGAAGKFGGL